MQEDKHIGMNPLFWLFVIVLGFMIVGQFQGAKSDVAASKQGYVQSACDDAKVSGDFSQCYSAESASNTEYLCNNSGNCWTEVN